MNRSAGLGAWLATLSTAELEAILRARPDVLRHPAPTDLAMLADRLAAQASVNRTLPELSKPALQVAEALLALGGSASREELYALLGATDHPDPVDAALAELSAMALAWPLHGRVRLAGGWGAIAPDPLGLGRSARKLYGRLTAEQLDRVGAHHGVPGLGKAGLDTVVAVLTDPHAVAERLSRADPRIAEAVRQLAWHGPRRSGVRFPEPGEPAEPHHAGFQLALQGWAVRRALDAGHTADGLLAALAGAADHPLPQPLEYLVRDVARQHGQVQVCAVSTCIRVTDPALGAELAAQRGLAPLRLRPLADTVLVSERPVAEVLEALRSAGYSPVEQDTTGATVITRTPPRRAPAPPAAQWAGTRVDVAALAARLTGAA